MARFFKSLFGKAAVSKEVATIFDKTFAFLQDERLQNEKLIEPFRSQVIGGDDCDQIVGATGEFGRCLTNPIPVNGPIGEVIYLSGLRAGDIPITFHRLGSESGIDIYETLTADGKAWDLLFLKPYHPRKSRRAPAGYNIISDYRYLNGIPKALDSFPKGIKEWVLSERLAGIPMMPDPRIVEISRKEIKCPPEHIQKLKALKLVGRTNNSKPAGTGDLETAFNNLVKSVKNSDQVRQRAVSCGVAFSWKIFNAKFGSVEEFRQIGTNAQLEYIKSCDRFEKNLIKERGDREIALGFSLCKFYLAAIIEGRLDIADRMAEKLEPFNREGSLII